MLQLFRGRRGNRKQKATDSWGAWEGERVPRNRRQDLTRIGVGEGLQARGAVCAPTRLHSLAGAGPLHLGEELLLHRVEQVGAKVARVQQDLVLQGDLRGKWMETRQGTAGSRGEKRPAPSPGAPLRSSPRPCPCHHPLPGSHGRTSSQKRQERRQDSGPNTPAG